MKTEKDFLVVYHSELRNIGLYISLSLASLAYSRAHREQNFNRNIVGIIFSLFFILLSCMINRFLWLDMAENVIKPNSKIVKWVQLLPYISFMQMIIIGVIMYTFYIEVR